MTEHPTARRLLRLYPRAWQQRYGDEFLDTIGGGALSLQQMIDITAGAIDAWLSPDVRRALRAQGPTSQGETRMTTYFRHACRRTTPAYTTRDSLIGAGVIVAVSLVAVFAGARLRSLGYDRASELLIGFSLPVSVLISMPLTLLKGQSWRAQTVIIGGTLVVLAVIAAVKLTILN